jgi:DNA-binding IclR family transcriptional regulator
MSSATKTLELLNYFSASRPEIGLSQLCKLAGRDKATTYRHLQALEETGFVEQNPETKRYRLGPFVLQLAQTRENTVPRRSGAEAPLAALADVTGETSHVSVLSGLSVYPLMSCESPKHSIRAIIDVRTFALHATASGMCALAFGPAELLTVAQENLEVFTSKTARTSGDLASAIETVRETGFGRSNRTFEDEIYGLSVPIFDQTEKFAGAVSVASVAARFTSKQEPIIQQNLIAASRKITHNWGGKIPAAIEAVWAKSLSSSQIMEPAS